MHVKVPKIVNRGYICSARESAFSWHVPRPSFPYWEKFERSHKWSFTEKAKIVNRGFLCTASESTCFKFLLEILEIR